MKRIPHQPAPGLTLVELMIALLLSSLVVASIFALAAEIRPARLQARQIADIQERAQLALELMAADLRRIDFWGCSSALAPFEVVDNIDVGGVWLDSLVPLDGNHGSLTSGSRLPLSDGLLLRVAEPLETGFHGQGNQLVLDVPIDATLIDRGDVLIACDMSRADVFQVMGCRTDTGSHNVLALYAGAGGDAGSCGADAGEPAAGVGVSPGNRLSASSGCRNRTGGWSTCFTLDRYREGGRLFVVRAHRYDVAMSSGMFALRLDELDGAGAQALVEGVDTLQICYGLDSDDDGAPERWQAAEGSGLADAVARSRILQVRLMVLVRGGRPGTWSGALGSATDTYFYTDSNNDCSPDYRRVANSDRAMRRWAEISVALRNRIRVRGV